MLKIFKKAAKDASLKDRATFSKGEWLALVSPTDEEIDLISKKYRVPEDFIRAPLDDDEKPRIEKEGSNILIIFRIPKKKREEGDIRFEAMPLGIIITPQNMITVTEEHNSVLDDFALNKISDFFTTKKTRFLIQIFARTNKYYLQYLQLFEKLIEQKEKEFVDSPRNQELVSMLNFQKDLMYFHAAVMSNQVVLERIMKTKIIKLYDEDEDLLEDAIVENRQAIEMTTIFRNNLTKTMDAFSSIISNNLNTVMKFLAAVTIILALPTMVASFYGMNVDLPFQSSPNAFLITLAISFIISLTVVFIFFKRKIF